MAIKLRETDYPNGERYIVGPIKQAREALARTMMAIPGAVLTWETVEHTADRAVFAVRLPRSEA